MDRKNFIRNKEDFICDNCGTKVVGTGYTNHCPKCLHSKHVDKAVPGDRANTCQGLMAPVNIDYENGEYHLVHKCLKCKKLSRNKISPEDDFEQVIKLSQGRNV